MLEKLKMQLDFLAEIDKMKNVVRQTLLIDKSRFETDAEHSWHFAIMALTLKEYAADPTVDINRVVQMALVHDLVEIYAGDTYAYDEKGYESKTARENDAADKLFTKLPTEQGTQFRALWEEFEEASTPDALYASAIDRLQPLLNNYMTDGVTWREHGVRAKQVYTRMEPIKRATPELWPFVEHVVTLLA